MAAEPQGLPDPVLVAADWHAAISGQAPDPADALQRARTQGAAGVMEFLRVTRPSFAVDPTRPEGLAATGGTAQRVERGQATAAGAPVSDGAAQQMEPHDAAAGLGGATPPRR